MKNSFFLGLFGLLLKLFAFFWAVAALSFDLWIVLQVKEGKGVFLLTVSLIGFTFFVALVALAELIDQVMKIAENSEKALRILGAEKRGVVQSIEKQSFEGDL